MHAHDISFADPFAPMKEEDWLGRVASVLKGADFNRKLVSRTHDGIAIQPLYARRKDAGIVAGARAGKPWRIMARVDHPDGDTAANLAREDLEGGADSLALVFPGARSARGHGLPSGTLAQIDAALAGVHLDLVTLRLDPAPAGRLHALSVAALIERRKLDPAQVSIDFGLDPVASLTSLGSVPWDWAIMTARLGETVGTLQAKGFTGPFVTVDVRPYHEAGASEGQELGAALAQGVLYLRALEATGMALADAFNAISFILPIDADQFMGIAKLKALRRLWARVAEACRLTPQNVGIHAETSWRMLTKHDPHVNILRNTIAAFAAGVGGADSLTVLPFTQALGLPDAAARRLARNTSLVLQEEASLWRVVDPAAGAGGFEALTDALCERAWALFREIEKEGGLIASLASGALQGRIATIAAERAKAAATRKEPITGTSEFANIHETSPTVLDGPSAARPILKRKAVVAADATPDVIAAFLNGASIADMLPTLGGKLSVAPLASHRASQPFEALRDRADACKARTGKPPQVHLVTLGIPADYAARLAFTRNFFAIGGIEVNENARLICLVGTDAAYTEGAVDLARQFSASGNSVWLAGKPGELEAALAEAGVSRFVFAGCDVVECLSYALEMVA